jgi:SAM-dependent methyltransferase
MYDYYLGGLTSFAVDRAAAERVLVHLPYQRKSALENRRFLGRAVEYLAGPDCGVGQFLDIGAGLPTTRSVHEMARAVNPAARVAYVDNDPMVVSHGKAMLVEPGCSVVVEADLRDPEGLLSHPDIRAHLDFSHPVGLLLVNVLHWVAGSASPRRILSVLRDALAPGSFLVLTHASMDLVTNKDAAMRALQIYNQTNARLRPRSRAQVIRFLDGWKLVEPGLVPKHQWRPAAGAAPVEFDPSWAGVAVKA